MNAFVNFIADKQVHDTVLVSMLITSLLAALRRIKDATKWWQIGWNFLYDWAAGFWSMRTGQQPHMPNPTVPAPAPADKN